MKKIIPVVIACALFASCQKESKVPASTTSAISQETLSKIEAHGFSSEGAYRANGGYYVEGDIYVTDADLNDNAAVGTTLTIANTEQYRTKYLIKGLPRTITVSLSGASSPNYSAALDEAILRYNTLNLRLKFQRVSANGEIGIVFEDLGPRGSQGVVLGQSAGFPDKKGNPPSPIKLNSNPDAYGSNPDVPMLATVMAHEIGHTIGFRHTDYKDRSFSCGGAKSPEPKLGFLGIGAVLIPGTPSGPDAESFMLACLPTMTTNRPFNPNDIIALNYLYK